MFEQNHLFEDLHFTNLETITLDKAIEELDEVNRCTAPICSTPKGGYSTTISTFANEFNLHTQLNQNKSLLSLNKPNNRKEKKLKNTLPPRVNKDFVAQSQTELRQTGLAVGQKSLNNLLNSERNRAENLYNNICQQMAVSQNTATLSSLNNSSPQKSRFECTSEKFSLEEESKYTDFSKLDPKQSKGNRRNMAGHLSQDEKRRKDVVNKIIIRSIRRFYLKLFKSENPNVVK